jgi:hypothetical protein
VLTLVLIILLAGTGLVILLILGNARLFVRRHKLQRILFRLLISGAHIDGVNRCDKGWLRWGTSALPLDLRHSRAVMTVWGPRPASAAGRCRPDRAGRSRGGR